MDTRMKFLEHELAAQERELSANKDTQNTPEPEKSDEIQALELRIRELEAMVKGITDEMLDLKSVTRRLGMQIEKLEGTAAKPHPEAASRFTVRRSEITEEAPAKQNIEQPAEHELPPREIKRHASVESPAPAPHARRVISSPVPAPREHVPVQPQPQHEEVPIENLRAGEFEYVMQPDGSIQKRRKSGATNVIIAGTGFAPSRASRSSAIRADSSAVIEAVEDDTMEIE